MFGKTLPRDEKLKAAGAFGAIAIASVVALDMMLFSGFQIDPAAPERTAPARATEQYSDMFDGAWRSAYSTISTAWTEADEIDQEFAAETLAGDPSSTSPEHFNDAIYSVPSEDDLYEEISALYAEQDRHAAARAEEREMNEAQAVADRYVEADSGNAKPAAASDNPEPVIAYENVSPW